MNMSPHEAWEPRNDGARAADTTASIHRVIAWFYGVIGVAVLILFSVDKQPEWGVFAIFVAIFGAFVAVHAALAAGARRRSEGAKVGSIVVGVLMLFGFPLGTIVGGYLIYNASRDWPSRRDPQAAPAGPDMRML